MRLGMCVGGNLGPTGTQGWTGGSGWGCLGLLCNQSQATNLLSGDSPSAHLPLTFKGVWEQSGMQGPTVWAGAGGGKGSIKDRGGQPPKRTTHLSH